VRGRFPAFPIVNCNHPAGHAALQEEDLSMPTLTECKANKWPREHHIKHIEDDVAELVREKSDKT
jgi:hypothetical protein